MNAVKPQVSTCVHLVSAPGETRTHTGRVLNPLPLPIGLRGRTRTILRDGPPSRSCGPECLPRVPAGAFDPTGLRARRCPIGSVPVTLVPVRGHLLRPGLDPR